MDLSAGLGTVPGWGYIPCMNLSEGAPGDVIVLGAGSIGHLMKALTECKDSGEVYAVYESAETMCRELLLLSIALDHDIAVDERVELFLEVFANLKLREKTHSYLVQRARRLLQHVTCLDKKPDDEFGNVVDLSQLKFKDRDALENAIGFVCGPTTFDAETARDHRLRGYYGERYDVRVNLVDWDYVMNLRKNASIIHKLHYTEWRMLGQAFEVREAKYTAANRTLASWRPAKKKSTGSSVIVRGYWGDIVVSPYVVFGVEAPDNPDLFKVRGEVHVSSAMEVSRYNVEKMLARLATAPAATRIVPVCGFDSVAGKARFTGKFRTAFVPISSQVQVSDARLRAMLRPDARLLVESVKFIASISEKDRNVYCDRIVEMGRNAGWVPSPSEGNGERPFVEFTWKETGESNSTA